MSISNLFSNSPLSYLEERSLAGPQESQGRSEVEDRVETAALSTLSQTSGASAGAGISSENNERTPPHSPRPGPVAAYQPAPVMPKTPFAPKNKVSFTSAFVLNALKILNDGCITKRETNFYIHPVKGMLGQHSQIYKIAEGSAEFIPGVPNERIFIKLFQDDVIQRNGDKIERLFLETLLRQYVDLLANEDGLEIVQIYNLDTVYTDGYLVVERLEPFHLPWNEHTTESELYTTHGQVLDQVTDFVNYGVEDPSSIPLDLNPGNFGMRGEALVLLDFMEHDEECDYAFHMLVKQHVTTLANGNQIVYDHLTRFFKENYPDEYAISFGDDDFDH